MFEINDTETVDCDCCAESFYPSNGYYMVDLIDRPNDVNIEDDGFSNEFYVLCRGCSNDFMAFMEWQ
jgi:hypothetical protein